TALGAGAVQAGTVEALPLRRARIPQQAVAARAHFGLAKLEFVALVVGAAALANAAVVTAVGEERDILVFHALHAALANGFTAERLAQAGRANFAVRTRGVVTSR